MSASELRATRRGRRISDAACAVFIGTVVVGAFFPDLLLKTVATVFVVWCVLGVVTVVVGLWLTRPMRDERSDAS